MNQIIVNIKSLSKTNKGIKQVKIKTEKEINNVADLIYEMVKYSVKMYSEGKTILDDIFVPLEKEQIDAITKTGKITFGNMFTPKKVNFKKAYQNAIQNFNDGIVVIFGDNEKYESIDEFVDIKKINSFTVIKLTMLAGRMW